MLIQVSGTWGDVMMAAVGAASMLALVLLCIFVRSVQQSTRLSTDEHGERRG